MLNICETITVRPLRHLAFLSCIFLIAMGFPRSSIMAQTRFEWPPVDIDLSRYRTVEDCLSVTDRIGDSIRGMAPAWLDTMPFYVQDGHLPEPAAVQRIAFACAEQFDDPALSLLDPPLLVKLYLQAGRESDAEALTHRRLAMVPAERRQERAALIETFATVYLRSQPIRLAVVESLIAEPFAEDLSVYSAMQRLRFSIAAFTAALKIGDTTRATRFAQRAGQAARKLTIAERKDQWYQWVGRPNLYIAGDFLIWQTLRDSLTRGTRPFADIRRANWVAISGDSITSITNAVGQQAPEIVGSFWFDVDHRKPSSMLADSVRRLPVARSIIGRTTLLVFLDSNRCLERGCWTEYTILQRLHRQFPEINIQLVARTQGYFSIMAPPAPAEEAELMRRLWQDFARIPGRLAVTVTPFFRLPGLDRRRIDEETPNETQYTFGGSRGNTSGRCFLIDRDGIIVESTSLNRYGEVVLHELIDVLLQRP